jgi:hypothetical protein
MNIERRRDILKVEREAYRIIGQSRALRADEPDPQTRELYTQLAEYAELVVLAARRGDRPPAFAGRLPAEWC